MPSPVARSTSPTRISTTRWPRSTKPNGRSGTRTTSSSDRAVPAMTIVQNPDAATLAGGVGSGGTLNRGLPAPARYGGPVAVYAVFALLIGLPLAMVLLQAIMPGLFAVDGTGGLVSVEPLARIFSSPSITASIL